MYPVLLTILGIEIKTSDVIWLTSSLMFLFMASIRGERLYGLNREVMSKSLASVFLGTAFGAVLFGIIENGPGDGILISLSSSGAVLFGTFTMLAVSFRLKVKFGALADSASIPAGCSLVLWRLGCLAEGCCRGKASNSALAFLRYPHEMVFRLPYPLMESGFVLLCVLILFVAEKILFKKKKEGKGILTFTSLILYSFFRLAADFMREDGITQSGRLIFTFAAIYSLVSLFCIFIRPPFTHGFER